MTTGSSPTLQACWTMETHRTLVLKTMNYENAPSMATTDDPISPAEVIDALTKTKSKKSGGPSGLSPGFVKLLPDRWILFLTSLFERIFSSGEYPDAWRLSRLITIHKKGDLLNTNNYRGISIMDCVGKLYDAILSKRLSQWFSPDPEQAGAQHGRGCLEHILALRLLQDFATSKRQRLFIVFVDFSKAYDRVPRDGLLNELKRLGCGRRILPAIAATYSSTQMMLGEAVITASSGVRQGSRRPASFSLCT